MKFDNLNLVFDAYNPEHVAHALEQIGLVLHEGSIAVLRDKVEEKSQGGIFIPDTARGRRKFGTVVAKAEGVVAPGLFWRAPIHAYGGTEYQIEIPGFVDKPIIVEVMHEEEIRLWYPTALSKRYEAQVQVEKLQLELGLDREDRAEIHMSAVQSNEALARKHN
jgi:hypothetical protein